MSTRGMALLSFAWMLLLAWPAAAQYEAESAPGHTLTPIPRGSAASLLQMHQLQIAAEEASGLVLDGLFRVEPQMSRFYELDRTESDEMPTLNEYMLGSPRRAPQTTPPPALPPAEPVEYLIDGQPIYIGLGTTVADRNGYMERVVASFMPEGGGMVELDRFVLGGPHSAGVYALDVTGDGVIELVCPFATGAGGGGGVEVRAVVPTGGLAFFGGSELDSTLFSHTGYVNLVDWDGNGSWEIETSAPVLCSACGYFIHDLWTFDRLRWSFIADERLFADFYAPQQAFYRKLNEQVQLFAADPEQFAYGGSDVEGPYAVQIDGRAYTLAPFVRQDGGIDQVWVQALKALVRSWR